MGKSIKVVNVPKEPTRHHLGNFGLVLIAEDLPQEICEAGLKAGLPYFQEVESVETAETVAPIVEEVAETVSEGVETEKADASTDKAPRRKN